MIFLGAFLKFPVQLCRNVFQSNRRHRGTVTVPFWLSTQRQDWRSMIDCSYLSAALSRRSLAVFQAS